MRLLTCLIIAFSFLDSANAIDLRSDFILPLTAREAGAHREPYDLITREVESFPEHSSIDFIFDQARMSLRLSYDRYALEHPQVLIPDALLVWYFKNYGATPIAGLIPKANKLLSNFGPRMTMYSIAEIVQNAREGDADARVRLLRWKAAAIEDLKVTDGFERQFPGTRGALASQFQILKAEVDRFRTRKRTIKNPIDREVLKSLVARNDRAAVGELLRKSVPWDSRQPVERRVWQSWIDAIEKPSAHEAVWLFRGFQDPERFQQSVVSAAGAATGRASANVGFVAPQLFPADSQIDVERADLGGAPAAHALAVEHVGKMTDAMSTHAEAVSGPSMFMSFTPDLEKAESFVSGSANMPGPKGQLLAIRVDPKRMLPNFVSTMRREFEYLAPLLIFPDEVMAVSHAYTADQRDAFISEIKQKGYRPQTIEQIAERFRSYEPAFLKAQQNTHGASCKATFGN